MVDNDLAIAWVMGSSLGELTLHFIIFGILALA